MTDAQLARYKAIVSVTRRQASVTEVFAVITSTVFYLLFSSSRLRWIIDFGYDQSTAKVGRLLLLMLFQLLIAAAVDCACMYQELIQGIPMLRVWVGRDKRWITKQMFQCIMATFLILMAFHLVPYSGECETTNICTCSYARTLFPLLEHCPAQAATTNSTLCPCTVGATGVTSCGSPF